ncbi:MAG: hypothetical protein GVY16_01470 [Planctomycetes bacterium]|jgi:plasmid stability protein|nr:hypothetical protein [Phycisphaerae bacterium]NBB94396.1 hypothetical protein [Planctomycetota bacterium]
MGTLSIHNLDENLEQLIRQRADRTGRSINHVLKEMLSEAVRSEKRTVAERRRDFEQFANSWTEEEGRQFNNLIEDMFERIDEEEWT